MILKIHLKKILFFLFIIPHSLFSQNESNLTYGLKAGIISSKISNLPEMIIGRDNTLSTYEITSDGFTGVEAGFFINFKLPNSRVSIQPEILYRNSGDNINYKNSITGKEYKLTFDYSYLVIGALYKIYPLKGLNVALGSFYSINLNPSNIEYTSNEANGQYDITTRQFFRDGIEGKNDFSISAGLGYEFQNSLHLDFRYYFGISDMIKNKESSFKFIENTNRNNILSFSIGYSFHNW